LNELRLNFADSTKLFKNVIPTLYENVKRVASLKYFDLKIHTKELLVESEKKKFIAKFNKGKVKLINTCLNEWNLTFYL